MSQILLFAITTALLALNVGEGVRNIQAKKSAVVSFAVAALLLPISILYAIAIAIDMP